MSGMIGQSTLNGSGLRPVEYKVIVLPEEAERTTKGGLLLAETTIEKNEFGRTEGVLVAVSPMAFKFEDWPDDAPTPAVGDRVMFSRYNAHEFTGRDGRKYWIMNDKAVMAVMEMEE